jgi:hypothetical protein
MFYDIVALWQNIALSLFYANNYNVPVKSVIIRATKELAD